MADEQQEGGRYPLYPRMLPALLRFNEELEYGDFALDEDDDLVEGDFEPELAGQLHRRGLESELAMSIKSTMRTYQTVFNGLSQQQRAKRLLLFGRNLVASSRTCRTNTKKFRVQALGASGAFAFVRVAGVLTMLRLTELVPGDLVELFAGCQVPATVRIIESRSLSVSSPVGARALGVLRQPDENVDEPLTWDQSRTFAMMGTFVLQGTGVAVVLRTGSSNCLANSMFLRVGRDRGSVEASGVRSRCLDYGTAICDNHTLQQLARSRTLVISLEALLAPEKYYVQSVAYNLSMSRDPAPNDAGWQRLCSAVLNFTPIPHAQVIDEESKAKAPPEMTPDATADYYADFAHRAAVVFCRGFTDVHMEPSVEVWRSKHAVIRFFAATGQFVYYEEAEPHQLLLRCDTMIEDGVEVDLTPARTLQLLRMSNSMRSAGARVCGYAYCVLDVDQTTLSNHGRFQASNLCYVGALGVAVALHDDARLFSELVDQFDETYVMCSAHLDVPSTQHIMQRIGLPADRFRILNERAQMFMPAAYTVPQEQLVVFSGFDVKLQDRVRLLRHFEDRPFVFIQGVADDVNANADTAIRAVGIHCQLLRALAQGHVLYRGLDGFVDSLRLVRSLDFENADWAQMNKCITF